ncbi:hypothetical protein AQJ84_35995 [Streptomyces resistomycificus]|uniref:Cobyrinic acid a,c-diamide synthase n=2 Tax=Streptomyces resistomycificus TaxID=67356 RepID=A0A0L8LZG9_9ACTN|nr:hypothetical protein ADK37_01620 [Streptomyces resistomycificus]KUN91473.1 hypothetical protein AQJ84_35995 [Streptomyces resistomycificus]
MALQASTPRRGANGEARVPAPAGESDGAAAASPGAPASAEDAPQSVPAQGGDGDGAEHVAADADPAEGAEARSRGADRSGRRQDAQEGSASGAAAGAPRKRGRAASRRPSGRERHDEKITVYVSAEELMDLEHARLVLRGEHGLAVDRGRIVREAVAVVLADLESRGDASILVRRLRGR